MKLDTLEDGTIRVKQLYNSIVLETDNGQRMAVCFRDNGIEFGVSESYHGDDYVWFQAEKGKVVREGKQVANKVEARKWNYGCDPDFMAALKRGDHMRGIGLTEEQIQKVLKITRQFPFKGEQDDRENLPET